MSCLVVQSRIPKTCTVWAIIIANGKSCCIPKSPPSPIRLVFTLIWNKGAGHVCRRELAATQRFYFAERTDHLPHPPVIDTWGTS